MRHFAYLCIEVALIMAIRYTQFIVYVPCTQCQVGGEFFEVVLSQMNTFGRVSVCGCISQYNLDEPPKGRVGRMVLPDVTTDSHWKSDVGMLCL